MADQTREDIPDEYKWNLDHIYESTEEWEEEAEEVEQLLEEVQEFEGSVTEDEEQLLDILHLREEINKKLKRLHSFAFNKQSEDISSTEAQTLTGKSRSLRARASAVKSFIKPEIKEAGEERIQELLAGNEELEIYEHHFEDFFRNTEHMQSGEVEEVLSTLGETRGSGREFHTSLLDSDLEFPEVQKPEGEPVELSTTNFATLLKNPDREFRQEVYETFYDTVGGFNTTVAAFYNTRVRESVNLADIRGYESSRHKRTGHPDKLEAYDTLLQMVHDNLEPLHRHVDLKADALDVDQLAMWDVYAPIAESDSPEIDFEEAKEHVLTAVEKYLGEEYAERAREAFEEGWIDVMPSENKRSGAYNIGVPEIHPFVMLNHQNDIDSMFTLAHELGHALHNVHAEETQPDAYKGYTIFTAEVASTVNEVLLAEHMLDSVDDEEFRKHVLDHMLEGFRSTFYRQALFADFEKQAHELAEEGEILTSDTLDDIFGNLKEEFYAPADVDDRIQKEWMRIPHFYRPFYVYQYSTGIAAANALADQIMGGEEGRDRYLDLLRSGSSDYSVDLLREAGVDLTAEEPYRAIIDRYDENLDRMEQLLEV